MRRYIIDRRVGAGFTLVELLVVVAIIALLLSILLPSLSKAREQAKQIKCLANLKDVGAAMNAYASDDAGENLIPMHWRGLDYFQAPRIPFGYTFVGPNEWGGRGGNPDAVVNKGQADGHRFDYQFTQHWSLGPQGRPLNRLLYPGIADAKTGSEEENIREDARADMPMFQCPSDVGWPADRSGAGMAKIAGGNNGQQSFGWDPQARFYDLMGNSYRVQLLWAAQEIDRREGFNGGIIYTLSPYGRPYSQIPDSGRTVLVIEGNAYLTELWNRIDQRSTLTTEMGINGVTEADFWATGWHGEFQTFASSFVDGHAGMIKEDIVSNVDFNAGPIRNPSRNDTNSDFPRGPSIRVGNRPEWIDAPIGTAVTYANSMARGEGWQLDCLPAPPVGIMQRGNN